MGVVGVGADHNRDERRWRIELVAKGALQVTCQIALMGDPFAQLFLAGVEHQVTQALGVGIGQLRACGQLVIPHITKGCGRQFLAAQTPRQAQQVAFPKLEFVQRKIKHGTDFERRVVGVFAAQIGLRQTLLQTPAPFEGAACAQHLGRQLMQGRAVGFFSGQTEHTLVTQLHQLKCRQRCFVLGQPHQAPRRGQPIGGGT